MKAIEPVAVASNLEDSIGLLPSLNTNSSYNHRKRLSNCDFYQDCYSRDLHFSVIYDKTAERKLPYRSNSMQCHYQACRPKSGRNFEHLLLCILRKKWFLSQ
ncbi:hypothetical protein TNCV_567951 [Trichonephila clavipes]|nr:hypothetical protein TNCV_567951 [Trichonephila clavipes]